MWIPASERGLEVVQPEMNQRSSVVTARRKTRFVVRRGRMGRRSLVGEVGSGLERLKRSCGGAKRESVPVPVRSGRCSPWDRMERISDRYWCSSWEADCGVGEEALGAGVSCTALAFSLRKLRESPGGAGMFIASGGILRPERAVFK